MTRNYGTWFLTRVKQAIKDYEMVVDGDRVAVGLSGGKDSAALLFVLNLLRHHSHLRFDLLAVYVDAGWGQVDVGPLADLCQSYGIPLYHRSYPIARAVEQKAKRGPCSLCAKLRSGILNTTARRLGATKVALGHHLDDVAETFFLNMLYTGQIKTFMPRTYLHRSGVTLIRPLIYLPGKVVASITAAHRLPVIPNPCPYSGRTKRDEVRQIVALLAERYPDFYKMFRASLENVRLEALWKQRPRKGKFPGPDCSDAL
ncbi:MAG: tRNA 2-thiocytidine biosynthesis TtcA family protein [Bacillota bacterium]